MRRRIDAIAPLIALVALLLQSLIPIAHAAAMAARAGSDSIVICTAEGPKLFHLAEDGSLEPVEQSGKLPPPCVGCPVGPGATPLVPVQQAEIGRVAAALYLPPPTDPAASPASPRYPPSQPRAPPTSL